MKKKTEENNKKLVLEAFDTLFNKRDYAAAAERYWSAAKQILTLFAKDRDRIQKIRRAASSALRVHEYMQKKPLVGIGAVADELKLSIPTVTVALDHLVRLGIAKEITGKRRARIFGYPRYLKILSEGTEPIQH